MHPLGKHVGEHGSRGHMSPPVLPKEANLCTGLALILATFTMTCELKAHEYGKDANSAGVYSGSVLHGNLHTRVSGYSVTRDEGCESGPYRTRGTTIVCRVNHGDPQHSFTRIPRQEFNPLALVRVSKFPRRSRSCEDMRVSLIRTNPRPAQSPESSIIHRGKETIPYFVRPPSINPLAARDQPVRTVQLSRGSSPSLTPDAN